MKKKVKSETKMGRGLAKISATLKNFKNAGITDP
jgi:hypothetical protein